MPLTTSARSSTSARFVRLAFAALGLHVGIRAVQTADAFTSLRLSAAELGASATVGVVTGILALIAGGMLVDRLGSRVLLVLGFTGGGLGFAVLAAAPDYLWFLIGCGVLGLFISLVDLGANAAGSDYERITGTSAMPGLHALFSLGAFLGALASALGNLLGIGFRPAYTLTALLLLTTAALTFRGQLPVHALVATGAAEGNFQEAKAVAGPESEPDSGQIQPRSAPARGESPTYESGLNNPVPNEPAPNEALPKEPVRQAGLWLRPRSAASLVALATVIVFFCFFGDGILETFLSVFVDEVARSPFLAGAVVAAFHAASWLGRVLAQRLSGRVGPRTILVASGLLASAGTAAGLWISSTPGGHGWSVLAFAVVGFALSPVVPLGMSMAGSAVPAHQSGRAIATVTTIGYGAFIASPLAAGVVADRFGISAGIGIAGGTMLLVALFSVAVPNTAKHA